MHDHFEIIPFLTEVLESGKTGRVHVTGNGIEWCLDIADGKLIFAAHSLQYLNSLETTLSSLGYDDLLPVYWRLTQLKVYQRQSDRTNLESLNWTSKIVGVLLKCNLLDLEQAEEILEELAEDAVESLLGLNGATVVWHPFPKDLWHATIDGIEITAVVDHVSERFQAWQSVSDRICSPYQRPYCEDPSDLYKPELQGMLSQQMLESLVRLMQGASIRQLAQTMKQDEAKLAQLLYPYIEQNVVKLWPPLQPFARLPWLPTKEQHRSEPVVSTVSPTSDSAVEPVVGTVGPILDTTVEPAVDAVSPTSDTAVVDRPAVPAEGDTVHESKTYANTQSLDKTKPEPNKSESNNLSKTESSGLKTRHLIICIDDSKAMLEKIEGYLDSDIFELKTIIDPIKAISKICTKKPSLVLMDISMPGISGNSLCSILKRSYMFKDVPFIMISGNSGALNKAKAEVSGAAGYLEKPFSKAQLMEVLDSHLKLNFSSAE